MTSRVQGVALVLGGKVSWRFISGLETLTIRLPSRSRAAISMAEMRPNADGAKEAVSLVFTGHMVDLPDRAHSRFPQSLEVAAEREIRRRVARQQGRVSEIAGFASAARGGDIIFHEVCRELGIKTAIVLPFEPEQFVATSVAGVPEGHWRSRFLALWGDQKHTLYREVLGLPQAADAYRRCNTRVLELAKEHGQVHLIALWDGKQGEGPGGTADLVEQARNAGDEPDIFSPDALI